MTEMMKLVDKDIKAIYHYKITQIFKKVNMNVNMKRREIWDTEGGQMELLERRNNMWNKKYTGWNYSGKDTTEVRINELKEIV